MQGLVGCGENLGFHPRGRWVLTVPSGGCGGGQAVWGKGRRGGKGWTPVEGTALGRAGADGAWAGGRKEETILWGQWRFL